MKNIEFREIYNNGRYKVGKFIVIYRYNSGKSNYGIVTSKKVGNSVVRHRVTRKLREIVRLNRILIDDNYSYVLVSRKPAATAQYTDLENEFKRIVKALRGL